MPENAILFVGAEGQVYGNASLAQNLTIPAGSTLTIPQSASLTVAQEAVLTNEGTVRLEGDTITDIPSYIQAMKLAGDGKVIVQKENEDGSTVEATYTNSGLKQMDPAGTGGALDLSNVTSDDASKWDTQGYKWTDVQKDASSQITSGKLVLAPGFNAETVKLPDATVEIVSGGECTIGTLQIKDGTSAKKTNLTLSGAGPLKIQNHVEISGGDTNSLTVSAGAQVEVTGGFSVGGDSINGVITVNGTLIAKNSSGAALRSGNVVVGGSGTLKVSGDTGVVLTGTLSGGKGVYAGAFTVQPGGRFEARCNPTVIRMTARNSESFEGLEATDIIAVPSGYLPQEFQPQFIDNKTTIIIPGDGTLFNISVDNVPKTPTEPPSSGGDSGGSGDNGNNGGDSGNSGGDSDDSDSSYTVTVEKASHGKVASNRRAASQGETVTLTVTPDEGYALDELSVTDSRGNEISLTDRGDGKYTFNMPGRAVTVRAAFLSDACTGGADCPSHAFSDLDTSQWYHEAVDYVLRNGLMSGYGDGLFGPNAPLSRAQFSQILHNREGRPVVHYLMQFVDVSGKDWYAEAVRWAASEGVVSGYGNGMFGPDDNITREQLALMLWHCAGSPAAAGGALAFTDADAVSEYALEALCWAVENGIVTGRDGGVLDPQGQATRAEAAAMLTRYLDK